MVTALRQSDMANIVKRDEAFTVCEYDNGYMLQCSGRDDKDDWATSKVMYLNEGTLFEGIKELLKLPKS